MKKKIFALIVPMVLIGMIGTGCKTKKNSTREQIHDTEYVPYTIDLKRELNISDQKEVMIQFYISGNITLNGELESKETQIENGVIKVEKEKGTGKIEIKRKTPGVVESNQANLIAVRFAQDGSKRYLTFRAGGGGRYYLQHSAGRVSYDGYTYVLSPESMDVYLVVNVSETMKRVSTSRTEEGVRVNEGGGTMDVNPPPANNNQLPPETEKKEKPRFRLPDDY